MDGKVKAWLKDIERSIQEINSYFPEKKNFLDFQKDLKTKRAVERNLEIIGEALNRIIKVMPDIKISNSPKIIGTRNRIIHGYDTISDDVIWGIVVRHLPILEGEVKKLLK